MPDSAGGGGPGRDRRAGGALGRLALLLHDLPVGVLAHDAPVVGEVEQVAAPDPDLPPVGGGPGEQPPGHAVLAAAPVLVVGVVHVGQAAQSGGQTLAHRSTSLVAGAPWVRPARHLQDAVVGEAVHDPVEVVRVERVEQLGEHGDVVGGHGLSM